MWAGLKKNYNGDHIYFAFWILLVQEKPAVEVDRFNSQQIISMRSFLFSLPYIPLSNWTILETLRWNHSFDKCSQVPSTERERTLQFPLSFWQQFSIGKLLWLIPVWVSLQSLSIGIKAAPRPTLYHRKLFLSVADAWFTEISDLAPLVFLRQMATRGLLSFYLGLVDKRDGWE